MANSVSVGSLSILIEAQSKGFAQVQDTIKNIEKLTVSLYK